MSDFCVILRTHYWDRDLEARFQPLSEALGARFIIAVDENQGPVDVGPHPKVSNTADRCRDMGLMITDDYGWRCGDYNFYLARQDFPNFDKYWLIEYDVLINLAQPARVFERLSARDGDMMACNLGPVTGNWTWTDRVAKFVEPVMACAFPFVMLTGLLIDQLYDKRRTHSAQFLWDGEPPINWPNDESFTATLAANMGFETRDLRKMRPDLFGEGFTTMRPLSQTDSRFDAPDAQIYHPVLGGENLANKLAKYTRKAHRHRADSINEGAYFDNILRQLDGQVSAERHGELINIYAARKLELQAQQAKDNEDFEGASNLFRQARDLDPSWNYHQPLMALLGKMGRHEAAMTAGDEAIAAGHEEGALYVHYAKSARAYGDLDLAIKQMEKALDKVTWLSGYWALFLNLLRDKGDKEAYNQALKKAAEYIPELANREAATWPIGSAQSGFAEDFSNRTCILLCATQRCGSTMVMEDMRTTGVLGLPEEYFIHWHKGAEIRLRQRIGSLLSNKVTDNGVFAAKIMADQLLNIEALLRDRIRVESERVPNFPFFRTFFDGCKFVRIRRRDDIRQAISRIMSRQTGINHATEHESDQHFAGNLLKGYSDAYNANVRYDGAAIALALCEIRAENARWDLLFGRWGVKPVEIVYEDYVTDCDAGLQAIADAAGVELTQPVPKRKMVKLSNARNDEWRDRFIEDYPHLLIG